MNADTSAEVAMNETSIGIEVSGKVGFGRGHLHAPEQTSSQLEGLSTELNDAIVSVDSHAAGQCIDGRRCACTMAGDVTETEVGYKMAGGPLQTAFAAIELVPEYYAKDIVDAPIETRIAAVAELLDTAGVRFGGHTTESSVADIATKSLVDPAKTGCGAAERYAFAVAEIASGDENILGVAQGLAANYDAVVDTYVAANTEGYSASQMFTAETALDNGANCEVLTGTHEELAVVFNTVHGTTLDRDVFVAETGKQVFWIDLWAIDELATKLTLGRPDATEMKPRLLGAMIAFQVATYNELGDGSHPVMVASTEMVTA